MEVISDSPERTRELGSCLASMLEAGDVIVLGGDLGAGKTVFAKGVARGLGAVEEATSPTFVILHQLEGRLRLYHFDLYRLDSAREFAELGFDDILYGDGVSLIEWGDKFQGELPPARLELVFHLAGEDKRRIEIKPVGDRWRKVARRWVEEC